MFFFKEKDELFSQKVETIESSNMTVTENVSHIPLLTTNAELFSTTSSTIEHGTSSKVDSLESVSPTSLPADNKMASVEKPSVIIEVLSSTTGKPLKTTTTEYEDYDDDGV